MRSTAKTVSEYLAALPPKRRKTLTAVRRSIKRRLPKGYRETMQYGMITWVVPLSLYPEGYLGKRDVPLPYVALASQKNHMAVYLMAVYADGERRFRSEWKRTGKKLDMGKSCVRFRELDDLALDVLGNAIARTQVADFVEMYEKRGKRAR